MSVMHLFTHFKNTHHKPLMYVDIHQALDELNVVTHYYVIEGGNYDTKSNCLLELY